MTTGQYIKSLRESKGLTQEELGNLIGVGRAAVNKWETGRVENIKRSTIQKLAEIFNVSPATFIPDEPNASKPLTNVYMIPVFENVSAGFGTCANGEAVEYMPLYISNQYDVENTLCIRVQGDSMFPKIENGDIIQVRKQDYVESGSVAVILIGDEGFVKKIQYGKNYIELHSFNPMYPVRRIEGDELENVKILGLVQTVIKRL